jgi:hypothetical protein
MKDENPKLEIRNSKELLKWKTPKHNPRAVGGVLFFPAFSLSFGFRISSFGFSSGTAPSPPCEERAPQVCGARVERGDSQASLRTHYPKERRFRFHVSGFKFCGCGR